MRSNGSWGVSLGAVVEAEGLGSDPICSSLPETANEAERNRRGEVAKIFSIVLAS